MTLNSMTGFARAEGHTEACGWSWEVKSVNAKGLDVRCRIPPGFEDLEIPVRERAAKRFKRGNLSVTLTLTWGQSTAQYRVNPAVLDDVLAVIPDIQARVPEAGPPSVDGLLGLRGVIEAVEEKMSPEQRETFLASVLGGFDTALQRVSDVRAEEGARLAVVLAEQLATIGELCARAGALASLQPDAIRGRLGEQVRDLMGQVPELPEERLAQEAAVLMTKADVREELDRLQAHHASALDLLERKEAVGRRLDFLCQEFNREANTLCSKAVDMELTQVGLELKATIEQFREQVQNIE